MANRIYTNVATTIDEQLSALKKQGLCIDIQDAAFYLERINYFRLARYFSSFKVSGAIAKFNSDVRFSDVLQLYYFDKELRSLLFSIIQTIEVAFRSKMTNVFSTLHSYWFMQSELAVSAIKYEANLRSISKEVKRSSEDFIANYYEDYDAPDLPPSWKTLEVLSFGQISKLYANFGDRKAKNEIAHYFNLPNHKVLISWLKTLSVLRNFCAHHSRVWNRKFGDLPQIPSNLRGAWIDSTPENLQKLYLSLCCAKYILNTIYPENKLTSQLQEFFNKYPTVKIHPMGFPKDWQNEPLWRE